MTGRKRILVIEDETLIALEVADILGELGCEVAGSAMHLDEALPLVKSADLDAAVLDVNLGAGARSFPVDNVWAARGIPSCSQLGMDRRASRQASPIFPSSESRSNLANWPAQSNA